MNDIEIQWHPGFVAAMNLELADYRDKLIYEKEYNLNTKPLEIDLLVIKKDRDLQITNKVGKIFRGHNIMEYKSPQDHLNIDTFYKTGAYASLYKAYGETVDQRKADDITVSIVRETRPEGLFQYFRNHGIGMTNPYKGIYYIQDAILFPTQIIVTRELEKENHTWLKALSDQMEKQEIKALLECIHHLTQEFDRELADSVLEVSIKANQAVVEELKGDESMCQALLEIMEPEINKIVDEATKKVEEAAKKAAEKAAEEAAEEAAIKTALKMLEAQKFSAEEIHEYVPLLSVEEIKALGRR